MVSLLAITSLLMLGTPEPKAPPVVFTVVLAYDGTDSTVSIFFQNQSQDPVTDVRIDAIRMNGKLPDDRLPILISTIQGGQKGKITAHYAKTHFSVNDDTAVGISGNYWQGNSHSNFNLNVPLFPDRRGN